MTIATEKQKTSSSKFEKNRPDKFLNGLKLQILVRPIYVRIRDENLPYQGQDNEEVLVISPSSHAILYIDHMTMSPSNNYYDIT